MTIKIEITGVDSVLLRFGSQPTDELIARISCCHKLISTRLGACVKDLVPSYTSLLLVYDIQQLNYAGLLVELDKVLLQLNAETLSVTQGREIILPVCYESNFAPDIDALASRNRLSIEEIIKLHTATEYRVYAIGFSPGFGYLGQIDSRIQVPRLATPRTRVPAGAVAVAEQYTAVYPQDTPGGWWIIGQCPVAMFDKNRNPESMLSVGDRVKFEPITSNEFIKLAEKL